MPNIRKHNSKHYIFAHGLLFSADTADEARIAVQKYEDEYHPNTKLYVMKDN
jgi:hypothetical protein